MQVKVRGKYKVDPTQPFPNVKWEKFVHNIIAGQSQRTAYVNAGYADTDNSASLAERLWRNELVRLRHTHLMKSFTKKLQKKALLSREEMLQKGFQIMAIALGEEPTKIQARTKDGQYYTEELYVHDLKSGTSMWEKLMNVLGYLPKSYEEGRGEKLDQYLEILRKGLREEDERVLHN